MGQVPEAFTRPKVMWALTKLGFTPSYTYSTWRNHKQEPIEYFTELALGYILEELLTGREILATGSRFWVRLDPHSNLAGIVRTGKADVA